MRKLAVLLAVAVSAALPLAADTLADGVAQFQQGQLAAAEAQFRQASGIEAQAWLALTLTREKKHDEAATLAGSVLGQKPDHAMGVQALGEALVGGGKYDVAVDKMSKALETNRQLAYAYYWRGQAYQNKRQPDRMVGDFENFLRLAPQAPEAGLVRQFLASLR